MTSLPQFSSVDEYENWRVKQVENENKSVYAVVHKEHGFVGAVSLHRHQYSAFFYFWIGADYQGQGYGQRAAQILFSMAEHTVGINGIYTCAFEDNSRSLAALGDLGFEPLPFKAKEPDEAYVFLTTDRSAMTEQYALLVRLLAAIESPIKLLSKGDCMATTRI
jgi:RimJ/RimL family protein N-acetyltransferase